MQPSFYWFWAAFELCYISVPHTLSVLRYFLCNVYHKLQVSFRLAHQPSCSTCANPTWVILLPMCLKIILCGIPWTQGGHLIRFFCHLKVVILKLRLKIQTSNSKSITVQHNCGQFLSVNIWLWRGFRKLKPGTIMLPSVLFSMVYEVFLEQLWPYCFLSLSITLWLDTMLDTSANLMFQTTLKSILKDQRTETQRGYLTFWKVP